MKKNKLVKFYEDKVIKLALQLVKFYVSEGFVKSTIREFPRTTLSRYIASLI